MESLELECIAGWVEEKEGGLFPGQAFKTNLRLDDETRAGANELVHQHPPCCHCQDCAEMAHRNFLAIDMIMFFVSGLVRA